MFCYNVGMKKLIGSLLFLLLFLLPTRVYAQESWVITSFISNLTILESGVLTVDEQITVDFNSLEKHGIYRELPVVYSSEQGNVYTKINVSSVTLNNSSVPFETIQNDNALRLKIGDPDETISGEQTYAISYTATGVLQSFENYDELYWNITGNNWEVPIASVEATVTLPSNGITNTACFTGVYGATSVNCEVELLSSRSARVYSTQALSYQEGMSVVVGYTKGLVPILTVEKPDPFKDFLDQLFSLPVLSAFFIPILVLFGFIYWKWYFTGRDLHTHVRFPYDPQGKVRIKPLGYKDTIVVEFEPPEQLRPAEIGVLMDERADTLDVTATIIDLAGKGYLTITEEKKKWMFGTTDYTFKRIEKETKSLIPYEKELLDKLFEDGTSVKLSELKTKFYSKLKKVKDRLYKDIENKKFFVGNPDTIRSRYISLGVGLLIFCAIAISFIGFSLLIGAFIAGIGIGGILILLFSSHMPRKTAYGSELYRRAKGYELFLSSAEKYRQQFFEKQHMFNEILPYTIIFGVTEKFAKVFKDLGIEPPQPTWYHGAGRFNAIAFGSHVSTFSQSFSSSIQSSPKSSGFSSGGGFSGGGFGGGGGGSW